MDEEGVKLIFTTLEVFAKHIGSGITDVHRPVFLALTANAEFATLKVDAVAVQRY